MENSQMVKIFRKGLMTGLFLQLAIGPVFFYIINLALQRTLWDGIVAVLAVTLVDYIYIVLALVGIGKIHEKKKYKIWFGIISSIVLIFFGAFIMLSITNSQIAPNLSTSSRDLISSFLSAFLLTISSPLTIVFWTSIFAAKAFENNFTKTELSIFGFAAGLATFLFMGQAVFLFSFLKPAVPVILIYAMNIIVGIVLVLYGFLRLIRIYFTKNTPQRI